ncbi:hypothetical protein [Isoptericola jiangsuensis]|uniref:hypothetical protein n=1 Tax=Isoptericola jiangsuensis TaxID=548579 RepID=UPI000BF3156D|nr:hypothetical protein [Isoptericola jiangsuensis]
MDVVTIDTLETAQDLAHRLLTPGRTWPVVAVSTAADADGPFVDVEALKAEIGDLAEVVLLTTGDPSWAFSHAMPPNTQVYGGASRVYPVDHEWVGLPRRSRLRFAYSGIDGGHVLQDLVHDVLGAALRAGLVGTPEVSPTASLVEGTVRGVVGQRAFVDLDDGRQATVAEELTGAGVPLDQVLARGLRVRGVLDPVSRLLDVAAHLPDSSASRLLVEGAYASGEVVLVRVRSADRDTVVVELAPQLPVTVPREHVTTNDLDSLDGLFEAGEVLLARVIGAGVAVRLDDVDESEDVPVPAVALLPGGPVWLLPPSAAGADEPGPAPTPAASNTLSDAVGDTPAPGPVESPSATPPAGTVQTVVPAVRPAPPQPKPKPGPFRPAPPVPREAAPPSSGPPAATPPQGDLQPPDRIAESGAAPARPTPALLGRGTAHRPQVTAIPPTTDEPVTSDPAPRGKALQDAQLALAAALTRAEAAEQEAVAATRLARQLKADNAHLLAEIQEQDKRVNRLENSLGDFKRKYRNADRRRQQTEHRAPGTDDDGPWFTDPADQFRHEVHTAWVRGVPAAQKVSLPLHDYTLGSAFLDSLALPGVSRRKIVETVVHVVTGRAADINGLQLHPLRTDDGGGSPQVRRDDGATCWRVSLQANTPAARRLHYWRLPDGGCELSRVVVHDDTEP